MIHIYEALDDKHVEITFFDSDGIDWGWHNTDTGERSDWTCETSRDALMRAAADFNIPLEPAEDLEV